MRMFKYTCEEGEERCDICQESDAMMERGRQRRNGRHISSKKPGKEQERQDRLIDSGIDIPSSSMDLSQFPSGGFDSNSIELPGTPPPNSYRHQF